MPFLKLVTDEPETDPPAPLSIQDWRRSHSEDTIDAIAQVEQALERSQASLDTLTSLIDEESKGPIPFPGRGFNDDDDGPWAA